MPKHLISIDDFSTEEIHHLFDQVDNLLKTRKSGKSPKPLAGKTLAMIFQKPSTRTRISFHVGVKELGGDALILKEDEIQIGRGETLADTARVMSRYVDGILIRTFKQSDVEALAQHGDIPIINGLTDIEHPCQILTDIYTIRQKTSDWTRCKIAYVGDGNNVANSWLLAAAKLGLNFSMATPSTYHQASQESRRKIWG